MEVRGHFFSRLRRVPISRDIVALNTARDVGGRLAAMAIWGTRANGGRYAAIAALTNIASTVLAYTFYEFILKDSSRSTSYMVVIRALLVLRIHAVVLTSAGKEFFIGHVAHKEHRERNFNGTIRGGSGSNSDKTTV
jgi:hypothetical protein